MRRTLIVLCVFTIFTVIVIFCNKAAEGGGQAFLQSSNTLYKSKKTQSTLPKNKSKRKDYVAFPYSKTSLIRRKKQIISPNSKTTLPNKKNWMLTLVNEKNPLPDTYRPNLKSLGNGLLFDERAVNQLNSMLSAAKAQGLSPVVCSAWRSIQKQVTLFNKKVWNLMANGLNRSQAEKEARKTVAYPGTSEHHLGLAVDIVSKHYQQLDERQADTPELKWLLKHCSEYGFILRYPKNKSNITGIIYEPWHFRYVGKKPAKEIMEKGLCLEEYLK